MNHDRYFATRRFFAETPEVLRQGRSVLRILTWTTALYLIATAVMSVLAVVAFVHEARFARDAVRARAVVVKTEPAGQDNENVTYEFSDQAGAVRRDVMWRPRGRYRVGSTLEILYVPAGPQGHPKSAEFRSRWLFTLLCGFCAVSSAVGTFTMNRHRWRRKRLIENFIAGVYGPPPFPITQSQYRDRAFN